MSNELENKLEESYEGMGEQINDENSLELTNEEILETIEEVKELEVVDPEIIAGIEDEIEEEIEETEEIKDLEEVEEVDPRDIIHTVEIATDKFPGDVYEYQKKVLIEYILTEFAEKRIQVVTEGCPCKPTLTTKIVRK